MFLRKLLFIGLFFSISIEHAEAAGRLLAPYKRLDHIRTQLRTGLSPERLMRDSKIVGVHGTSVYTIREAMRTGFIPPGSVSRGWLYYWPVMSRTNRQTAVEDIREVVIYAGQNQQYDELMRRLGFVGGRNPATRLETEHLIELFDTVDHRWTVKNFTGARREALDFFEKRHGISNEQLLRTIYDVRQQNLGGVIFGLNRDAPRKFLEDWGDEIDKRLFVGKRGLPVQYIRGMQVLSYRS